MSSQILSILLILLVLHSTTSQILPNSIRTVFLAPYTCTNGDRNGNCDVSTVSVVCGWFNPQLVQCSRYPCAGTYDNTCSACKDPKVYSVTQGSCPTAE